MTPKFKQNTRNILFGRLKVPLSLSNLNNILVTICLLYSIVLLWYSCTGTVYGLFGDGHEYLGMTVSFHNHLSPDLIREDIILRKVIENKNGITFFSEDLDFSGYFESKSGKWYSYHFWIYSLLNIPAFSLLHKLDLNELRCFQITNTFLLLLSLWAIVIFYKGSSLNKFWFFMLAAFNPVLFYIPWTHPEIFSYSFILLSVIFALNSNFRTAVLTSSIASLQNPAITILPLFFVFACWKWEKCNNKELLMLLLISSISAIPYLFYYINYNTFSLITLCGLANISYVSLNKIGSLFFDVNFGLLPYFPILIPFTVIFALISVQKRKWQILQLWALLLLIALICSTQRNWNSGMMYINRYAVLMIPIVLMIAILSTEYFSPKKISTIFTISLIITAVITGPLLINYDGVNYVNNNMLSNYVLTIIPMVYNPPFEVFSERAIHMEVDYIGYLPVIYAYDGKPRKILTDNQHLSNIEPYIDPKDIDNLHKEIEHSGIGYINFEPLWVFPIDPSKISIYHANNISKLGKKIPEYELGKAILFGKDGNSEHYQIEGFSIPEDGYSWTDGPNGILKIKTNKSESDLTLSLTASPFLGWGSSNISHQRAIVMVNEHEIGEWFFDKPGEMNFGSLYGFQNKELFIPKEILVDDEQLIKFEFPDAISPNELGLSEDSRNLALAVHSIMIDIYPKI